jgi:hypothetical protein
MPFFGSKSQVRARPAPNPLARRGLLITAEMPIFSNAPIATDEAPMPTAAALSSSSAVPERQGTDPDSGEVVNHYWIDLTPQGATPGGVTP